jgi:hypothetical protein
VWICVELFCVQGCCYPLACVLGSHFWILKFQSLLVFLCWFSWQIYQISWFWAWIFLGLQVSDIWFHVLCD